MLVIMNLTAIAFVIPAGLFFGQVLVWVRPGQAEEGLGLNTGLPAGVFVLLIVLIFSILMLILHEGIHGLFFWIFTRSKPVFALKSLYAYAAAPEWYLPRNQYLVVSLSPLILISLLCGLLFVFIPQWLFLPVWGVAVFNAAGSVGDLFVAVWLFLQPGTCLANDRGDIFSLYLPDRNGSYR
mgnify:CR=1 FL=1